MNTTPRERAPRFALQLPLRYRAQDELRWHEGKIENISRSGVLFRGEHPIEPDTPVEVSFFMPATVPNESPAEVICLGLIVRTVQTSSTATLSAFAASILEYRFIRGLDNAVDA